MNSASTAIALTGLVGLLTPYLTALVQQPGWTPHVRTIVGVVVSAALGAVTYFAQQGFDVGVGHGPVRIPVLLATIAGVITAAQVSYSGIVGNLGVGRVEQATSPDSIPPAPPTTTPGPLVEWPGDIPEETI